MTVKVRQQDRYQSVKSVKVKLKHWKLRVEKRGQLEDVYDCSHYGKCHVFLLHKQIQEACYKVHALAVVQLRVYHCICVQNLSQIFIINSFRIPE